jgi:hypothetical protein
VGTGRTHGAVKSVWPVLPEVPQESVNGGVGGSAAAPGTTSGSDKAKKHPYAVVSHLGTKEGLILSESLVRHLNCVVA